MAEFTVEIKHGNLRNPLLVIRAAFLFCSAIWRLSQTWFSAGRVTWAAHVMVNWERLK
jgi:hypothetical protein